MIKGEANINSASISADGSLLVMSTSAEIKLFHLMPNDSVIDALRISRVEVPQNVSTGGARIVQFSPDGHWLCIVRKDNRISSMRVVWNEAAPSIPKILPTISRLERPGRKTDKRVLLGGLGKYDRTITRVAFSSDSRILAVSDLAGYVDTWALEGYENLSQDIGDDVAINDASSSSSSDGSDSDNEEEKPIVILGQQWIRNPSASLLPKLPSTPVVLSFRPANAATREAQSNGAILPHATRHNPYPRSHDLPNSEDRLLIVTATSQIFEFEVLRGGLSPWSRSNPTANFPEEYKGLRDQAMGCIWDVESSKERVWLYGSNWMWMYDLSRNLPRQKTLSSGVSGQNTITNGDVEHSRPSRKRKRGFRRGSEIEDLRKDTSGAGSRVPDSKLGTGMSRKIQRVLYEDNVKQTTHDWRQRQGVDDSEEDGSDENMHDTDGSGGALDRTSRGVEGVALQTGQEDGQPRVGANRIEEHNGNGNNIDDGGPPHWWHTYKYRPIMGIVPLDSANEAAGQGVEVAVVERPMWEVDLPPRYYGDQEWEKPGV
jgi:U3 small nucleolar RNA-associated protein 4